MDIISSFTIGIVVGAFIQCALSLTLIAIQERKIRVEYETWKREEKNRQ